MEDCVLPVEARKVVTERRRTGDGLIRAGRFATESATDMHVWATVGIRLRFGQHPKSLFDKHKAFIHKYLQTTASNCRSEGLVVGGQRVQVEPITKNVSGRGFIRDDCPRPGPSGCLGGQRLTAESRVAMVVAIIGWDVCACQAAVGPPCSG